MKSLVQTYLIGGGVSGLVLSVPLAGYCWIMWRGFGGDPKDLRLILGAPVICIVALAAGVIWKRADQQRADSGTKNPADAKPTPRIKAPNKGLQGRDDERQFTFRRSPPPRQ
jgi:hypothetical protein